MTRGREKGIREAVSSTKPPDRPGRSRQWLVVIGAVGAVCLAGRLLWTDLQETPKANEAAEDAYSEEDTPIGLPPSPSDPAAAMSSERLREETIAVANHAIRDMPNRPEPIALLAVAQARFGSSEEAVKCWKQCLALDPDFAAAYDSMGRLALHKGNYADAAENLEKALAIAPGVSQIHPLLADALMALGRNEEAKTLLEKHFKASARDPEILYRLGKAEFHLNDYESAKEKLEEAIQIAPDYSEAYYTLSSVCARLRLADEVKKYRKKFQELKAAQKQASEGRRQALYQEERLPEFLASICYAAGNLCNRTGKTREAKRLWTKGATANPKDVLSRHQLTLAYLQESRPEEAREILGQMREIEPENPIHCLNLGFLVERMGQFDAAEDAFRTACELAPQQSAGYVALARLYIGAARLSEARAAAQDAVQREPNAPNYSILGAVCAQIGDSDAALAAMEAAMKMDPTNAEYPRLYEQIQRNR